VNDTSIPLCLDVIGTLTPANPAHERALGVLKRVAFDVAMLPFRADLLQWLREERARGRRVVLVADGDPQLAEQIAAHLELFDEVARTDGAGSAAERKRRALVERFGERGFDYAGSDAADMAVWETSRGAIVVGDRKLSERVGRSAKLLHYFAAPRPTLRTWIKAIRLHQWVKNALVFLPALLAHQISNPAILLQATLAFIAFGCCASSVYVTNDLFDLAADRQHPRKRRRPFAAGLLSVRAGIYVSAGLFVCAALIAVAVGWMFVLVLASYYVITWAYSLRLKRIALLDVMTLAGLYTLRIIAGCAATRIEPSFWLLALSVFLFLSLGFVKRYAELDDARKAGKLLGHSRGYGADDLPLILSLGTTAGYSAIVVVALYINSPDSIALYHHKKTLWMICPLMLFWISRVWMLTARGHMHDDPVVFALRDRVSLIVVAALGLIVLLAI
jgi:4-hydroxybenzoate polyprenyltransferase